MNPAHAYASGLVLLAVWGVFTGAQALKATGPWAARRWQIVLVDLLLAGSSFLCAGALVFGLFRPWMLLPLGASFLAMIPLPCYFAWVDSNKWRHAARNVLFVAVAAFFFAVGLTLLPLAYLSL